MLDINFPKIKSVTTKNKPPKIIKNGLDISPSTFSETYYFYNVKKYDNFKITLYPYGFEKKLLIHMDVTKHYLNILK